MCIFPNILALLAQVWHITYSDSSGIPNMVKNSSSSVSSIPVMLAILGSLFITASRENDHSTMHTHSTCPIPTFSNIGTMFSPLQFQVP